MMSRTAEKTIPTTTAKEETTEPKLHGLCAVCVHASECVFPRDPERPITHCDEFEGYEPRASENAPQKAEPAPVDDTVSELKGLCKYCEIRETCKFPKPAGGVWHCDEFE
jgi:hypothetical protein